jgi:hypothetical protein
VDRVRASSTIGSALVTAAIALGVFGLIFVITIIYIG